MLPFRFLFLNLLFLKMYLFLWPPWKKILPTLIYASLLFKSVHVMFGFFQLPWLFDIF